MPLPLLALGEVTGVLPAAAEAVAGTAAEVMAGTAAGSAAEVLEALEPAAASVEAAALAVVAEEASEVPVEGDVQEDYAMED